MHINGEVISKRIYNIMIELGLNQNKMARLLNTTQPAISKYLQGRIPPPLILLQLAKLSGKSIEWILTGESGYLRTVTAVAEKQQEYYAEKSLEVKIKLLPIEIQKNLESLIESLLNVK